jgi:hypothetical protein
MTVRQAIRLKFYTTRSLKPQVKRDETAWYIRLVVRARGEGDPDTVMRDAEGDGLKSDNSPMGSDTDVRNPVDDSSSGLRQIAWRGELPAHIPRPEAT